MKYLKEELDIKAGIKKFKNWYNCRDIHILCFRYGIKDYTINADGTVDVHGDVDLWNCELNKIPLNFGEVSGSFNCKWNNLTTLIGSPKRVGENFDCDGNDLTSLEGCPTYIGGGFYCQLNRNLWSMDHFPRHAKGVYLDRTPIEWVFYLFRDVYLKDGGEYFTTSWSLMDFFEHCDPVYPGKIIKKRRMNNFLNSIGKELTRRDISNLKDGGWKIED